MEAQRRAAESAAPVAVAPVRSAGRGRKGRRAGRPSRPPPAASAEPRPLSVQTSGGSPRDASLLAVPEHGRQRRRSWQLHCPPRGSLSPPKPVRSPARYPNADQRRQRVRSFAARCVNIPVPPARAGRTDRPRQRRSGGSTPRVHGQEARGGGVSDCSPEPRPRRTCCSPAALSQEARRRVDAPRPRPRGPWRWRRWGALLQRPDAGGHPRALSRRQQNKQRAQWLASV